MGLFEFFKKVDKNQTPRPLTSAVIVAAGNSSRMGKQFGNKQLIEIDGIPIIARTISAFEAAETIDEIIITTKEELIIPIADIVKEFEFEKVSHIIKGGDTRQKSVEYGINNVRTSTKYVCIHDGARPFITPLDIDRVNSSAYTYAAAAIGVKVKDTIKQIDCENFIVSTVDRSKLLAVQTPQSFNLNIYISALELARKHNKDFTDDCQLIENAGGRVYMLEGSYDNIKITTSEDLSLAHVISQRQVT